MVFERTKAVRLSPAERRWISARLRRGGAGGVAVPVLAQAIGRCAREVGHALAKLAGEGMVEIEADRARLTPAGATLPDLTRPDW